MIEEGLVVFNSTHDSIKAENICAEKGIYYTNTSIYISRLWFYVENYLGKI